MAYRVTNISPNYVVLTHGSALEPGESRAVSGIGNHELNLQKAGSVEISRDPREDPNMDDAIYVEVINEDLGSIRLIVPAGVTILNVSLELPDTWYMVAPAVERLKSWKLQLRRVDVPVSFDYKYAATSENYMTCFPGEVIFADTVFPSLFVRCSEAGQTLEVEYWQDDS